MFALLLGGLGQNLVNYSYAASGPTIFLSPGAANVNPDTTFNVEVRLDTAGQQADGVEAYLSYPSNLIQFVSFNDSNSAFGLGFPSSGGSGMITIRRTVNPDVAPTVSGPNLLVITIVFKSLNEAGAASVNFTPQTRVTSPSSGTASILTSMNGGIYTVTSPPPQTSTTSPPAQSGTQPPPDPKQPPKTTPQTPLSPISNNSENSPKVTDDSLKDSTQTQDLIASSNAVNLNNTPGANNAVSQKFDTLRWSGVILLVSAVAVGVYAIINFLRHHQLLMHHSSLAGSHHSWLMPTIVPKENITSVKLGYTNINDNVSRSDNLLNQRLNNIHGISPSEPGTVISPAKESTTIEETKDPY